MTDLTAENVQLILIFVAPGFLAMKVFGLLVPQERPSVASSLLEAMSYSLINLAFMSWLVLILRGEGVYENHRGWYLVGTVAILLISPVLLAIGTYALRESPRLAKWVLRPDRSAWDHFFRKRIACFVLLHPKKGQMLGGFFGAKSFASGYPNERSLYLEEVWRVDKYGRFTERVAGSQGLYIPMSEVHRVEFFEAKESAQ